jgi:hypothetical protein
MTWAIAPTALVTLGLSGDPVHEPVHADGEKWTHGCNPSAATKTHRTGDANSSTRPAVQIERVKPNRSVIAEFSRSLNQGGACGAAGPASAPPLGLRRPARRTPGHTAKLPRSAQLIRYSSRVALKSASRGRPVLPHTLPAQSSGQVMNNGWERAEIQTVSAP